VSADIRCRLLATGETGTLFSAIYVGANSFNHFEHGHRQLKPDMLADGQPVEFTLIMFIVIWTCLTTTATTTILRLFGLCPRQPGWDGTRENILSLTPIVVINHPLSASSIFYDLWYPPFSIYMPDSLISGSYLFATLHNIPCLLKLCAGSGFFEALCRIFNIHVRAV